MNHNASYYHFGNVDEMALAAFEREMAPELTARFADAIAGTDDPAPLLAAPAFERGFARVRLFAGSDSAYLRGIFRGHVERIWLDRLGVGDGDLSADDRLDLRFALSGVMNIIGDRDASELSDLLQGFLSREMGQGVRATIARIAAGAHRSDQVDGPQPLERLQGEPVGEALEDTLETPVGELAFTADRV